MRGLLVTVGKNATTAEGGPITMNAKSTKVASLQIMVACSFLTLRTPETKSLCSNNNMLRCDNDQRYAFWRL